jgi:predicted dehydrogenase
MKKQKGVLIGCGMIAREHLAAIAEMENVEIAAVCDLSPARAEATAERFGIAKWYSSSDKLLADVRADLVHITTPPASHFSLAQTCLSAGLNVLCEKPITADYHELATLKRLATENDCLLMENQNLRYHSSIKRISDLINSGKFGSVIDIQICIILNVYAPGIAYIDRNVPHFSSALRGGIIGDFLPHIAYLAFLFTGHVIDLRTIWAKSKIDSPFPADEFRSLIKGERATAHVAFSGNAQPNGFWLRVAGTKMHVECNLFEPPRLTIRRFRTGEPALMSVISGIAESRDVLWGTLAGFWRKLGGVSSYDGLPELIARTYGTLEANEPQPVPLEEIDEVARLVERFTSSDVRL